MVRNSLPKVPQFWLLGTIIILTATDFHVFVSKTEKQVAELVNINLGCMEVAGYADAVMVIDGSTAIFLRVGNNVDEVVGTLADKSRKLLLS